ncbi:hypothetical protein EKO27_g4211 [Xylaria grammica]|uniref:NACHT domain-containing protein n=1 Tax=Xylaria grammica TaxID=363999 RepID=A0A439D922_9PEZI|nr:hypothetical protein EKO27_g4211 [Xylaria grammica]
MAAQVGLRGGSKMFSSIFNPVIWLTGGAVAYYFYISFCQPSRPSSAPSQQTPSSRSSQRAPSQGLTLIYPEHGSKIATDIDVIAIHGFDTDSSRTWEWEHDKSKDDKPEGNKPKDNVNWLKHKNMLRKEIPTARIFTCDWPAPLFESRDFFQKTIDEFARVLLNPLAEKECPSIAGATWGIVFLATPFKAFRAKYFPSFLTVFPKYNRQHSATLSFITSKISLDRSHVRMNKFEGPEDAGYKAVASAIKDLVDRVRDEQLVEKAKAEIRNTYCSGEALKIERLSGDKLPIDQCYINLAIVEKPNSEAESSSTTYSNRNEITLQKLFGSQNTVNGKMSVHRRLLIHGRAGVGKTTLCKKIVYEFIHHNLWRDVFDYVLWIPLRRLKEQARLNTAGYNLAHLFLHEYLRNTPERERLAEALETEFRSTKGDRFLFLLEGLDEAPQSSNSDMGRFLEELLSQTNVIVTSRPNAALPQTLQQQSYLRLETFGFSLSQINSYVRAAFKGEETHQIIQSFLDRNQIIRGLMCIPIQLDALCYTWDGFDNPENIAGKAVMPDTMTTIYLGIEQKLWKKDALDPNRLGKLQPGSVDWEILESIEDERHFLELFAFNGMYYDIINFEPTHRKAMFREYRPFLKDRTSLDGMLGRVSFMRSSDTPFRESTRNYHFIHLRFQEYFAARYIVRKWTESKPLEYFELTGQEKGETDPLQFLKRKKYNERYNVLWRFVAGLLNTHSKLPDFLQAIEADCDLLGPVHQRLVAHCLTEVSTEHLCRKNLEDELFRWVEFSCQTPTFRELAARLAISKAIVDKAVKQNNQAKVEFLDSLSRHQSLREESFWAAASCINNTSRRVRSAALGVFNNRRFTEQQLQALGKYLRDKEIIEALGAFIGHQLTNDHLRALEPFLEDPGDRGRRDEALKRLKNRKEEYPNDIRADIERYGCQLSTIKPYLSDGAKRQLALEQLRIQPTLSDDLLQAIAECLEDKDESIRSNALWLFHGRPGLSDDLLRAVKERLKDEDATIKSNALRVFEEFPNLSEDFLKAVTVCFKDESSWVRRNAIKVFASRPLFSTELHQAVAACLTDGDVSVRCAAMSALMGQPNLSMKLLSAVEECIKGMKSTRDKHEALRMFEIQPNLSDNILEPIATYLKYEDGDLRCKTISVFKGRPNLSDNILEAVAVFLKDENRYIRHEAINVLEGRPTLPDKALQTVAACFKEKDWLNGYHEIGVSRGWPTWPKALPVVIKEYLKDEDSAVQREAENLCLGRPILSEQLHSITAGLKQQDHRVREGVLRILSIHRDLSSDFLDAVVETLGDLGEAKQYALELLKGQLHLEGSHLDVGILLSRRALDKIGDVKSVYKFLSKTAFRKHNKLNILKK